LAVFLQHGCGFLQPLPQLQGFSVHAGAVEELEDFAAERLHLGGVTAGLERVAIALRRAAPALGGRGRGIVLQKIDFRGVSLGHALLRSIRRGIVFQKIAFRAGAAWQRPPAGNRQRQSSRRRPAGRILRQVWTPERQAYDNSSKSSV
jgi:hypothetical protein